MALSTKKNEQKMGWNVRSPVTKERKKSVWTEDRHIERFLTLSKTLLREARRKRAIGNEQGNGLWVFLEDQWEKGEALKYQWARGERFGFGLDLSEGDRPGARF